MRERIQNLIDLIKSGRYDNEAVHGDYDRLLEEYINGRELKDESIYALIVELISLEKDFWYA